MKPLRKPSTSLSNLLDNTSEYIPSQESTSSHFFPHTFETSPHVYLVQIHKHLIFLLSQVNLLYDLQDNTLNLSHPTHFLRNLIHNHTLHLDKVPLHYYHRTLKLRFIPINFSSEVLKSTPVPAHNRIPEYYTAEHSRPPTPNFADYPIRVV